MRCISEAKNKSFSGIESLKFSSSGDDAIITFKNGKEMTFTAYGDWGAEAYLSKSYNAPDTSYFEDVRKIKIESNTEFLVFLENGESFLVSSQGEYGTESAIKISKDTIEEDFWE